MGSDDYYYYDYYDYDNMVFHVKSIHPGASLLIWTSLYTALCVLIGFVFKCRKRKYKKEWEQNGTNHSTTTNGNYVRPDLGPSTASPVQSEQAEIRSSDGAIDVQDDQNVGPKNNGKDGTLAHIPDEEGNLQEYQNESSWRSCFGADIATANTCGVEEVLDNAAFFDHESMEDTTSLGSDNSSKAYELWESIFGPDGDEVVDHRTNGENSSSKRDLSGNISVDNPGSVSTPNVLVSENNSSIPQVVISGNNATSPNAIISESCVQIDDGQMRKMQYTEDSSSRSPSQTSDDRKSGVNASSDFSLKENKESPFRKRAMAWKKRRAGGKHAERSTKSKMDQTKNDMILDTSGQHNVIGLKCAMFGRRRGRYRIKKTERREVSTRVGGDNRSNFLASFGIRQKSFVSRLFHTQRNIEVELMETRTSPRKTSKKTLEEDFQSYNNLEDPEDVDKLEDTNLNSSFQEKNSVGDSVAVDHTLGGQVVDTSGQGENTYKNEMKEMYNLAAPWIFSSVVEYASSIITVALISNYMSIGEMIAYSYVWFILEAAHLISSALYNSLYKHVNNAVALETQEGCDKAGKYIRICIGINVFLSIPASVGVVFGMGSIMRMYGYGEKMVELCSHYTIIAAISNFASTTSGFITCTTEIDGHADFNAMYSLVDNMVSIALAAFVIPVVRPNLTQLGLIHMAHDILSYIAYYYLTWYRKRWYDSYTKGMMTPITFKRSDKKAISTLIKKTIPMTIDELNGEIEWLVLVYFAAHLGNAESISWILLSYIWGVIGIVPYCIGSAAEYRVSNQLSKGNIILAKQMATTAMIMAGVTSLFGCTILFLFRFPIVKVVTNNDVLVKMLIGVIPFLLICNPMIALTTIAGYLNRSLAMYQRSTKIEMGITCFITIPAAWVSTYSFGYDIAGLIAASYIGYASMGVVVLAIYMNADWEKAVRKNRKIAGIVEPKDSELPQLV